MVYLPWNLTYREEILLVFALTIASPRYKQMAASQKNSDVFVPIPRTRLAHAFPRSGSINAEPQGRQASLRGHLNSLRCSAGAESNRFKKRTSTEGHLC
jgi:hypothetical protein